MPRYYFHVLDRGVSRDDLGTDCSDIRAAQAEAVRASGQMVQEVAADVGDGADWRMEVTDERDRGLFVVRVAIEDVAGRGGNAGA